LPNVAPPKITEEDKKNIAARELVQAALLCQKAGLREEASAFIQAFVRHEITPKSYRDAAELAAEMKHCHDAIRIAKDGTNKGMFLTAQSYPVMTEKLNGIDTEWAF